MAVDNESKTHSDDGVRIFDRMHQYVQTFLVPLALAILLGAVGFWYRTGVNIVDLRSVDTEITLEMKQLKQQVKDLSLFVDRVERVRSEILHELFECQKAQSRLEETVRWACGVPGSSLMLPSTK